MITWVKIASVAKCLKISISTYLCPEVLTHLMRVILADKLLELTNWKNPILTDHKKVCISFSSAIEI